LIGNLHAEGCSKQPREETRKRATQTIDHHARSAEADPDPGSDEWLTEEGTARCADCSASAEVDQGIGQGARFVAGGFDAVIPTPKDRQTIDEWSERWLAT
jgi:hypothetical protein